MKKVVLMLALVATAALATVAIAGDENGKKSCCSKESSKSASLAPADKSKKSCCSKEGAAKTKTTTTTTAPKAETAK